jgi:hypothetical protein
MAEVETLLPCGLGLIMAWAQMGRAQEGVVWTIKANTAVDSGCVFSMREFSG